MHNRNPIPAKEKTKRGGLLCFRRNYMFFALTLFLIEVFIAVYVRDRIIRPYGGDFLVIGFLYCLCRSFLRISAEKALVIVLLFAFALEALQLLKLSEVINLQEHQWLNIVLGSHLSGLIYLSIAWQL